MVIKQYYKNKMIVLTLLCAIIIYIYLANSENARIKLNNLKQKQHRDLCKYLSNNMLFYDKTAFKNFMIDQYYEMVIISGKQILSERYINNIYANITLNSIITFYKESCV
jgi:hypothetical protein